MRENQALHLEDVAATDASSGHRLIFPGLQAFYSWAQPVSYALLRCAFGLILLTHGIPKASGAGHGGATNAFMHNVDRLQNQLHLPVPLMFGYLVMFIETAGAVMMALGLFTRIVAPMIAIEMAVICYVLSPAWVWNTGGMEYALLMGLLALFVSIRGGGRYSIDRLIGREL
ncbi:MAG TPA: DoxX family protein [Stellaceae bacterium]|nr:DoxX family protein [Stellaceae bacterium]